MSLREDLLKSYKKGGLSNGEIHHPSRAYERYFEGYQELPQSVPNRRRSKSVRIYVAEYYVQDLSKKKRLQFCILFVALYILTIPPFIISAVRDSAANTAWYVTLPQAVALFSFGWMALSLFHYCTVPQKMTIYQYKRAVTHFHRSLCLTMIALAAGSAAYLIHSIINPSERANALLGALCSLVSFRCILTVFLLEHRVRYMERSNPLAREADETQLTGE